MKKTLKMGIMIIAAMAMVAGNAMAADYTINMCGASAQAGFWQKAGGAVLASTYGCTGSVSVKAKNSLKKKIYVVKGTGCEVDGDTTTDDTIYIRYYAKNSDMGCQQYDNVTDTVGATWPKISGINWTAGTFNGEENATCMLGCADVPCRTICAETSGYPDGFSGAIDKQKVTDYTGICSDVSETATPLSGVVVPFGFIVNNAVTQKVCEYSGVNENADLAYDKTGWACEIADDDPACVGMYKCVNGTCQDGTGNGAACESADDCLMAASLTSCVEKPLKNISRLQVLHIFSGKVDNWSDFGPSYPDLPIVRCMRHAGSGTHQTLIDTVMRSDASPKTNDYIGNSLTTDTWTLHYESSTDLTSDCVARFDGAIGYVDADKVMGTDIDLTDDYAGNEYGIHQLMYQGSSPSRTAVANGEYNFWAAQTCYYEGSNVPDTEEDILATIMEEAKKATYLSEENFGERAYFWATQEEMQVVKYNNDPAEYPESDRD